MNRLTKKFVSISLSIAMLISVIPTAFATNLEDAELNSNEVVIEERSGYSLILKSEDYENGDACFYMIENEVIIYKFFRFFTLRMI